MKFEVFWKNPGYKIRPELKEDIDCDYLIIGGGITGASAAYFLAKAGAKNVVLIEKHYIASGATGKAAGTLVIRGETDLLDIVKLHGEEKAEVYWKEIHGGLNSLRQIIREENIDCDAETQDSLYCTLIHKYPYIKKEYEAEKRIEPTTKLLNGPDLKRELNTDMFSYGILSANHGLSVNPLKLTQNLSVATEKYGARIFENTALLRILGNIAQTHHGNIRFKKVITAIDLDNPNDKVKNLRTTILITQPLTSEELIKTGMDRRKIVFDSKKSYNYFKVTADRRMLFGFGNMIVHKGHRKTEPHVPHLKNMEKFMAKLFPYLALTPEYVWSGNFGVTRDYCPLIEINGDASSISGAGSQVICFMAAKHIVNKILGEKSSLEEFFTG